MDKPKNGHEAPSMGKISQIIKIQFPNEIVHLGLGKINKILGKAQETYKNTRCLLITYTSAKISDIFLGWDTILFQDLTKYLASRLFVKKYLENSKNVRKTQVD